MKRCCSPAAGWSKLASDSGISDPTTLDDEALADAIHALAVEEQTVSEAEVAP